MPSRTAGHVTKPALLISRVLWQAQHAIEQAFDALLEPLGLTAALAGTLTFLAEAPGSSAADLARGAGVTAQSMAYVTGRLEQLGLIVRSPHPVHGRIMQLNFTPYGRQALAQASAIIARAEEQLLNDLPSTARQDFLDQLAIVRERAEHLGHIAATSSG